GSGRRGGAAGPRRAGGCAGRSAVAEEAIEGGAGTAGEHDRERRRRGDQPQSREPHAATSLEAMRRGGAREGPPHTTQSPACSALQLALFLELHELRVAAGEHAVDEDHREGGEAGPELDGEPLLPLREVAAVLEVRELHALGLEELPRLLDEGVLRHA